MTFKEAVQNKLIISAKEYQKLIGIDFVVTSKDFKYNNKYVLRFHKDNFLHLTGVFTNLKAKDFFDACFNDSIGFDDFVCDSSNDLKGKIKEKLRNLSTISSFFDRELVFQEMFEKNRVKCKVATSDGRCTLGFTNIGKGLFVPLTLLNKNQIDKSVQISDFSIIKIKK